MQDDWPPVVPNPRQHDHPMPTGREAGAMPTWPAADMPVHRASRGGTHSTTLAAGLALSLGANAALIVALLVVFLLARASYFSPHTSTDSGNTLSGAVSSPTATISPTAAAGWLQVAPASVQLGCDSGQQTQFAVLMNSGPEDVRWQAMFPVSSDRAGISISPRDGNLRAGTSIVLQIQSKRQPAGQQGAIQFEPDASAAGASPSLSYTAASCS